MTADGQALLAAVLADTAADLPRLVFADWCDDHGEHDRADLIRTQVELERLDAAGPCWQCQFWVAARLHPADECPSCPPDRAALRRRERALMLEHGRGWWGHSLDVLYTPRDPAPDPELMRLGLVRRGFLAELTLPVAGLVGGDCWRCPPYTRDVRRERRARMGPDAQAAADIWCGACGDTGRAAGCAGEVFRGSAVERVVLLDVAPYSTEPPRAPWWWDEGPGVPSNTCLPPELFARLPDPPYRQGRSKGYESEAAARDAASAAAVALGRHLAELQTPSPSR